MAMLRQFNAIVFDTVREARAQKVFVGVAISTTLSALLLMWYVQPLASRAPSSRLTAMSRIDPRYLDASFAAHTVYSSAASMLFWVQILLAMTMTASMLVPLLSPRRNFGAAVTPIPRSLILLGRYVGAITPACLGVALAFGAVWVAASLKLGVWHGRFLWGAAVTALAVAASAALTALLQLVAKSHAIAVLAMVGVGLLNVAAQSPEHIRRMTGSEWLAGAISACGAVVPRYSEMSEWTRVFVGTGDTGHSFALWASAAATVVFLWLACLLFSRTEF